MREFKRLDFPRLREYYTKYPQGYTIYESLLDILEHINEVTDIVNLTLKEWEQIETWVLNELQNYTIEQLQSWLDDGTMEVIINDVLFNSKADKSELVALETHLEIEPDALRENESETDGDLLQKAIDLVNADNRKTKSIKLGRIYDIDKTINVGQSIGDKSQPFMIITGTNGGLRLGHDGYMFDGNNNAGGILFDKVKFEGTEDYTHPLINGTHLIQLNFTQCQFYSCHTIVDSTDYLQSYRFTNCNFKGMKDYQIKSVMVYDMHLLNNLVEWGEGGFLLLTQESNQQYSDFGLFVKDNVIEGISEQIPIKTTHLNRAVFDSNYFEGNTYTDMDLAGGSLPHRGLTITNNTFGVYVESDHKKASIKVGKLYDHQGYNFTGNTCAKVLFDFSGIQSGRLIDLTGGTRTNGGQLNYIGTTSDRIGSYVSKSDFEVSKPKLFTNTKYDAGTSHTLTITLPRKGVYLMTTRALFGGDPDWAIHETVLLTSEGLVTPLQKTLSLSKEYINVDTSTNNLNYVFRTALKVDVTYTHPNTSVTVLDVTLVPITNN